MKIAIYCGHSVEEWNPGSIKTGIGGSEEAVINISKEFNKLGHDVTVFSRCGDGGDFDGVAYRPYESWHDGQTVARYYDVLIIWRQPSMIKKLTGYMAKKKYLWLHDTIDPSEVTRYCELYDKVMVLSKFHRNLYKGIEDEKFFITRNGVDLSLFNQKIERVPYKMVYGSSYDRGLKDLLENWTKIKTRVPEATLSIFYGWATAESLNTHHSFKVYKEYMEHLMDQEGITHHGRIGHEEVAKEYLSADIWAYPTWWPEISCISAMKAQIGGAVPVVVPAAAVDETVLYGYKTPQAEGGFNGQYIPEPYIDYWVEQLIVALRDRETLTDIREVMRPAAIERYGWDTLAKEWENEFSA